MFEDNLTRIKLRPIAPRAPRVRHVIESRSHFNEMIVQSNKPILRAFPSVNFILTATTQSVRSLTTRMRPTFTALHLKRSVCWSV